MALGSQWRVKEPFDVNRHVSECLLNAVFPIVTNDHTSIVLAPGNSIISNQAGGGGGGGGGGMSNLVALVPKSNKPTPPPGHHIYISYFLLAIACSVVQALTHHGLLLAVPNSLLTSLIPRKTPSIIPTSTGDHSLPFCDCYNY
jgi:hypothetical protein